MDSLYLDGRHYDLMFPRSDDVDFLLDQVRLIGGPVLELACGTGRILEPIARAGFSTTGVDLSPPMLAEARRKAQLAGSATRYVHADVRHLSIGEQFAVIFIAGNSICHLLDIESFDACMACVREHLMESGRFIVDVYVPSLRLLLVEPHTRRPMSEYDDPDGAGRVVVTQASHYDAITQIKSVRTFHKSPGRMSESEGSLELKMYFPQELQALLRHNGFRIVEAYGDYDKAPLTNRSAKQIYVLEPVRRA
jgi:SAM-dependent methyltransferase